jgi:hypothetical protein
MVSRINSMLWTLKRRCPDCGLTMQRVAPPGWRRHKWLVAFADLPYWLLFAAALAAGASDVQAGWWAAGGFVVLALGLWRWVRARSMWWCARCTPCDGP